MKQYIKNITAFVTCLLISSSVWGEVGTTGTWTATEISTTRSLYLESDISVKGIITIKSGGKLTINSNNGSRTIKAIADIYQIFMIEDGGTLEIIGTETAPIIIDGGATFGGTDGCPFIVNGSEYTQATASGYQLDDAIRNSNGTLTLTYVTIKNVNGKGSGGALMINGSNNGESRPSTLTHCKIYNCQSEQGSAIQITNTNGDNGDAEKCKLTVQDSEIYHCYSWGDLKGGSGGTIRTNGGCVSHLYFINTTVRDNYTAGAGCGIYWNGKGTDATTCYFDNCTFENNVALGQGGGMMLETNFEFRNGTTTIKGNKVLKEDGTGGGIVVTSYGGNAMAVTNDFTYTFTYDLSDKVTIEENYAGQGAGISFNLAGFSLNKDWQTHDEPSRKIIINLNLVGAIIKDNHAKKGNGGGIRFFNNTANATSNKIGNRSLTINVKLNKGTITGNTATQNGAGIYLFNANIDNDAEPSDLLTVNSNEAENNGGGIYVDGGNTIKLNKSSMKDNRALKGAAIYLSGTSGVNVTLGQTTMDSNIAMEEGGALYVNGGNLTISDDDNNFTNNSSTNKNGGFAYVSGTININGSSNATGNHADNGDGGCFYIENGNLNIASNKSLSLQNNTAQNGGAVYLKTGNINVNGSILAGDNAKNTATEKGGAVYLNNGNLTLNDGTFSNNTAQNGGGIYMGSGQFILKGTATFNSNEATTGDGGGIYLASGNFTVNNTGTINVGNIGIPNKANMNGGGIFCSGTFVVEEGGKALVKHNTAKNGGGVCVQNGNVTLPTGNNCEISNNTATTLGGGLYVLNNTNDQTTASFNGGTFLDNKAAYGGGACANGKITLNISSTFERNIAHNGGAIYMMNGVNMTFSNGLIRTNLALQELGNTTNENVVTITTAKNATYDNESGKVKLSQDEIYGFGGGIFMDNDTELSFLTDAAKPFGIYNNAADCGADDIFTNGHTETKIALPQVANMELSGYSVPGDLYWVEDYPTNDNNSPKLSGIDPIRYEKALEEVVENLGKLEETQYLDPNKISHYLCLTLGYELVWITLEKENLQENDDVTFTISYFDDKDNSDPADDEYKPYRKVIFSGIENAVTLSKKVAIPAGKWKFEESTWGWKYDTPIYTYYTNENDKTGTKVSTWPLNITRNSNKKIKVTNVLKDIANPENDAFKDIPDFEHRKRNILRP